MKKQVSYSELVEFLNSPFVDEAYDGFDLGLYEDELTEGITCKDGVFKVGKKLKDKTVTVDDLKEMVYLEKGRKKADVVELFINWSTVAKSDLYEVMIDSNRKAEFLNLISGLDYINSFEEVETA